MRKILVSIFAALNLIACGSTAQQIQPSANTNTKIQTANETAIVSSRFQDTAKPNASTESPMARPIDASALTDGIERAEKEYKKNPKAKEALAKAYFIRAFALTEAAQYRAALGDFRKGLKLNPNDTEAKAMHDQIIGIFKSINREPPAEGTEPAPLPIKKDA